LEASWCFSYDPYQHITDIPTPISLPVPEPKGICPSFAFHTRIPQHSLSGFRRFLKEGCGRSMGFGLEMKDCA
jgi:hypothetical protein